MPNQKIKITGIDPTTGKLVLSDRGRTNVNSRWWFRKVTWETHYKPVETFRIVGKTANNPFEERIPIVYDDKVKLTVNEDEPEVDWEYSIHWKDKNGKITISDPIISIRPSTALPFPGPISIILLVLSAILGFLTLKFLRKRKSTNS